MCLGSKLRVRGVLSFLEMEAHGVGLKLDAGQHSICPWIIPRRLPLFDRLPNVRTNVGHLPRML